MRVLQVTPYFAPAWAYGGPPRVMYDYATGLADRGHQVVVFTTDVLDAHRRAGPREEVLDGVAVRRFPNLSNSLAWRTKKYLPRGLVAALTREVASFDVVHVTDVRTALTAAAYWTCRARRVPFCLSAHGSLPGSPGVRGAVKKAYDVILVRPMLQRAALLLAQTDHESELYVAAGSRLEAVKLLPLPLAAPAEAPRRNGFLRRRAGVGRDDRIALFLGRIHYLKGFDLLVEALVPLLERDALVLAVIGRDDGFWAGVARRFAPLIERGRIRFLGPIYGDERFAAYADADVFCLTPRHWEETSVAALEAAASGTPVVVSEQSDIPGLAAAGGGFVVRLAPAEIRDAVERVLADDGGMGRRAAEHVRRRHSKEAVVERLETLLDEVAE